MKYDIISTDKYKCPEIGSIFKIKEHEYLRIKPVFTGVSNIDSQNSIFVLDLSDFEVKVLAKKGVRND